MLERSPQTTLASSRRSSTSTTISATESEKIISNLQDVVNNRNPGDLNYWIND